MTPNTKISTLFTQTDRKIVIDKLKNNPLLSVRFRSLKGELKERMIDFLCGTATLPLTYDPFFKKLFNPDIYPERLENFISSVLKKKVKIKCVLSQEDSQLQGATMLILDIKKSVNFSFHFVSSFIVSFSCSEDVLLFRRLIAQAVCKSEG